MAKVANPLKLDPTRTITLRRAFAARLRKQFAELKRRVMKLVVMEDAFGLKGRQPVVLNRFKFSTDPQKIKDFQAWLKTQLTTVITSHTEEQLWEAYAEAGYKKGGARAFDDTRKPYAKGYAADKSTADMYRGSKEEFLRSSFGGPIATDKIKLLAGRSFDDLENVTADMSTRMSRVLTDGLVKGDSPRDVARDLADEVDIGKDRALTIARTEIIRAHAEGQLDAYEKLGVEEVGAAIEFSSTEDEKVCDKCDSLEGVVLTVAEARGIIPVHPNCRCAWIPADVGEDDEYQKDDKRSIDAAFRGADMDDRVSRNRPQSIVGNESLDWFSRWLINNSFCPTGEGGGVDPTCSSIILANDITSVNKDELSSSKFRLVDIPIDFATHQVGWAPSGKSRSSGPVVVDVNPFSKNGIELLDGNHRVHEARLRGEKTIKAYVGDLVKEM